MMKEQRLSLMELFKLWFKTLFYNSCLSWSYAMDTMVEPLFYLVDHMTAGIGRMFVVVVSFLIGTVVIIAHLLGIPFFMEKSPVLTIGFLIPIGYWLLMNVVFNFVQGVRVSPGIPDNQKLLSGVTICKKCISPKPPRTHHCSICNRCYLKMDHHCRKFKIKTSKRIDPYLYRILFLQRG
jgi:palmitoyltransferase